MHGARAASRDAGFPDRLPGMKIRRSGQGAVRAAVSALPPDPSALKMAGSVAKLTVDDMIGIAAYTASPAP